MPWFVPIISFAGRMIIKRPIMSAAGSILAWEYFDADGNVVGRFIESEISDIAQELGRLGVDVVADSAEAIVSGFGEAIPEIIERVGPAVITGINNTVEAIRKELKGQEVKVISTFMVFFLSWVTAVYIISWVRNAGESVGRGL